MIRYTVSEVHLRTEMLALPCFVHHTVQLIDLFESEAFGFVDQSPDEENGDEAGAAPDKENFGL